MKGLVIDLTGAMCPLPPWLFEREKLKLVPSYHHDSYFFNFPYLSYQHCPLLIVSYSMRSVKTTGGKLWKGYLWANGRSVVRHFTSDRFL